MANARIVWVALVIATLGDACIGVPRKRPPLIENNVMIGETGAGNTGETSASGGTGTTGASGMTGASGASCVDEQGCAPLEACISGKCETTGCSASAQCRAGCCSAGTCVAPDGCGGDKVCSGGVCPARCDDASGGAGCRSGCCQTTTGACTAGTADAECGTTGDCRDCGGGSVCSAGTCQCAGCTAGQVCVMSGCAACASSPCAGTTPVCDGATTHTCQPCTASPGICSGATTFCNNDGACSATPTSDAACAREDSQKPKLVSPGVCGCDATTPCNNGLTCDLVSHSCFTSCTINSTNRCAAASTYCDNGNRCVATLGAGVVCTNAGECTDGNCECSNATCSARKCSSVICGACEFTADGLACAGDISPNTPNGTCTGTTACDGSGNCDAARGQPCSVGTDCSTGICEFSQASGGAKVCSDVVCALCKFTANSGVSCAGNLNTNVEDPGVCEGNNACDGSGNCKIESGQNRPCTADSQCISGHCEWIANFGTSKTCSQADCTSCEFNLNGDGNCEGNRIKNLNCNTSSSCVTGETECCDGGGTCRDPGGCTSNCIGSAPSCSPSGFSFVGCDLGASETGGCGFSCGACNTSCSTCVCRY